MNYLLTEAEITLRNKARKFALEHLAPVSKKYDEEETFPGEILKLMGKEGYLGLFVPKEYGGSGGGVMDLSLVSEEFSRVCCGISTAYAANALATYPIILFGNHEQKSKYLVPVAKGDIFAAFGLTEPNAGSDAAGIQTTAVKDGDHYILNGTKQWITNGGEAGVYTVFASTDRSRGPRGLTAFIVEADTPGFTYGKKEDKLGIRCSSTRVLMFENCRVPASSILGKEGQGFIVAMRTFDKTRPGVGAEGVGIAQGALDKVMHFLQNSQKREFVMWQSIQGKIAEMATRVEASRALTYTIAKMIDGGEKSVSILSAMGKMYASETATYVSRQGMEIAGEYGASRNYGLEKYLRDAKITEIYEGTNEIQREIISLGLIREYCKKED